MSADNIKSQRIFIEQNIESLTKEDHIIIFKIIRPYINRNATTDQDTVVDLSKLPDNILTEVKNMVEVCLFNNKREEEKQKYKNEHENNMLRLENELLEKSKNMSFGV